MTTIHSPLLMLPVAAVLLFSLSACGGNDQDDITTQEVPRGSEPIRDSDDAQAPATATDYEQEDPYDAGQPASAAPSATGSVSSAEGRPNWVLPADWQQDTGERAMRHSTFITAIEDEAIEIAVSVMTGDAGGLAPNVNRWRSQVGLGAIDQEAVEEAIDRFDQHPGYQGYTLHLQGDQRHMLIGAIFEEAADRTWFVRATLTPRQAPRLRPALFDFVRSFGQPAE